MAKRYDQKKKDAVVAFVQKYNEENGRGGQSAAVKKFSINAVTVKGWMDKAGVPSPGKTAKKRKPTAVTRRSRPVITGKSSSTLSVLERMTSLQEKIEALQEEFDQLKLAI